VGRFVVEHQGRHLLKSEKMTVVQTLFTNDDGDERWGSSSRRARGSVSTVVFGMWGVSTLISGHDIPFALLQLLLAVLFFLDATEILPPTQTWPWPFEVGLYSVVSVVGVAELMIGRALLGWACCALGMACIGLVVVKRMRHRPVTHPLE
jgi:hypothetical protein